MLNRVAQIGAVFRELAGMKRIEFIGLIIATALAVGTLALYVQTPSSVGRTLFDPTVVAPDDFIRWEQPASMPSGWSFEGDGAPQLTRFDGGQGSSLILYHSDLLPIRLDSSWSAKPWNGGWIIGDSKSLQFWQPYAGQMAAHWHPRLDGLVQLERLDSNTWVSRFIPDSSALTWWETTWASELSKGVSAPLPKQWKHGADWLTSHTTIIEQAEISRMPPPNRFPPVGMSDRWNGTWAHIVWKSGVICWVWGWEDSTGVTVPEGDFKGADAWYQWSEYPLPSEGERWMKSMEGGSSAEAWDVDAWRIDRSAVKWGRAELDNRVTWRVKSRQKMEKNAILPPSSHADESKDFSTLGEVRNHRSGKRMALLWEDQVLSAVQSDGKVVWDLELSEKKRPKVWEVDLYRNGKYQVAIATEQAFHVVDVLGREVNGFPIRPHGTITAAAVMDYDLNRNYRFLLATSSGEIMNYRKEGEQTSGWGFQARKDAPVVHLEHLRVGSRDFIYTGYADGQVELLNRRGATRFKTEVRVPPNQSPAFRYGKDIESSTVLYVDESGWIQERTFGSNTSVGISQIIQGIAVRLEDRDGDGIKEVIVTLKDGVESIWNARNEQVNP